MMRRIVAVQLALALAVFADASAQEPGSGTDAYAPAKPVERRNPDYPRSALQAGREGWVTLSFVISPTGEVTEPMIVESSHEAFEEASMDAVLGWRYEPARRNGEPVEEAMIETTITFARESPGGPGARASFRRRYSEITAMLQAGDLGGAAAVLDELERDGRLNLYEDAWFWFAKAYYLEVARSPDLDARLQAFQRAVGSDKVYLSPELFVSATQRLYGLFVQRGEFGAAVQAFQRLRDSSTVREAENYAATLAAMQPSYDRIMTAVNSEQVIAVPGKIGEHYYWVDKLLRRSFELDAIDGRVDVVDIRCKLGTRRFGFADERSVWNVPESWGDCRVYIKGEPGTTFTVLQHPAGLARAPAAVSQPQDTP